MQIQGATALVAGGASGLGAATARRLAEAGANVTIADLNEEKGEALAGELGATFVRCDVTEPDEVEAAVPEGVRISVCCAASAGPRRSRASAARTSSSRSASR